MKRSLLVAALAALMLAPAAAALTAAAPVSALAASRGRIAYATAWTAARCERVAAGAWSYAPRLCPGLSTGRGVAAVAVAGNRVLWLSYAGGNIREWALSTATTARPRPRLLRFVAQDVDLPPPIVVGRASPSLLPYAVGRTVVALRADGSRAFAWKSAAPVVALSASGSTLVAADATGRVTTLAAGHETSSQEFPQPATAAFRTAAGLVVQTGATLRLGSQSRPLPGRATLEDARGNRAVYAAGGRIHVLDLRSGADRIVAAGSHARLARTRLAVASGRRISLLALP